MKSSFKSFAKSLADFFLFTSLFIAVCAACMVYQTCFLLHIPVGEYFISFVFFGTVCSYNFHWFLPGFCNSSSYKTTWSLHNKWLHFSLFLLGLTGSIYCFYKLLDHWLLLLVTAFITFLYSAPKIPFKPFSSLKDIAFGKTIFLSLAWTHCTVLLPIIIYKNEWQTQHYLFAINRFFLIYAICILFDYRDRHEDKASGIRSLITQLNDKAVNFVFWTSILISLGMSIALNQLGLSSFYCTALALPVLTLALLYNFSKRQPSDYLYYFVLDGLMMFSSLLLLVGEI